MPNESPSTPLLKTAFTILLVIVVTTTVGASSTLWSGTTNVALAASSCQDTGNTPQSQWDGFPESDHNGYGSSAWIVDRSADFCSGTHVTGDTIYSMAELLSDTSNQDASAGMMKRPGDTSFSLYGYWDNPNCSPPDGFFEDPNHQPNGTDNDQYAVIYSSSSGKIEDWAAGYKELSTPTLASCSWDPFWWHRFHDVAYDPGDDMPGSPGTKQSFTSVAYAPNPWSGSGSFGFTNLGDVTSGALNTSQSYYCNQAVTGSSFNIWTDRPSC